MTTTQDRSDPSPSQHRLTQAEVRQLDRMAAECPRCDQWLGRLLMHGLIRMPAKDDR